MSSTAIRVAVIDDHQVFADALASRLGEESDLTVVGTARTASDSWELLKRHPVDVIALDLDLAGEDGLRLGREILAAWPDIGIVVVTGAAEEVPRVLEAVQMGVRGWVDKADTADTLVAAVRAAGRGESRIPAEMLTKALMYLSAGGPAATPEQEAIGRLTNRERDVLYGLMDGLSRTQIGELLKVSPNTVRTHVQSILSKLNVHSALGAVALARKAGVSRESADA